jgi:hypothetical protein
MTACSPRLPWAASSTRQIVPATGPASRGTASQPQDGNSRDTLLGGRYGQTASQPAAIAGPDRPLWEASKTGTPALQCA